MVLQTFVQQAIVCKNVKILTDHRSSLLVGWIRWQRRLLYKVNESDYWWKIKHYAKQWLQPFLKCAYQLKKRRSLLVQEVWGSNPDPIKSTTRCQQLATAATFEVWSLTQSRGDGHRSLTRDRSLVTPERVLSEYNRRLYFCYFFVNCHKKDLWSHNSLTFTLIIRSIY